jgi:hypothetical protein
MGLVGLYGTINLLGYFMSRICLSNSSQRQLFEYQLLDVSSVTSLEKPLKTVRISTVIYLDGIPRVETLPVVSLARKRSTHHFGWDTVR